MRADDLKFLHLLKPSGWPRTLLPIETQGSYFIGEPHHNRIHPGFDIQAWTGSSSSTPSPSLTPRTPMRAGDSALAPIEIGDSSSPTLSRVLPTTTASSSSSSSGSSSSLSLKDKTAATSVSRKRKQPPTECKESEPTRQKKPDDEDDSSKGDRGRVPTTATTSSSSSSSSTASTAPPAKTAATSPPHSMTRRSQAQAPGRTDINTANSDVKLVQRQPCYPGIFRLKAINPALRTDIRVELLRHLNKWYYNGYINVVASGDSDAASAAIVTSVDRSTRADIWRTTVQLVDQGQRTGTVLSQDYPNISVTDAKEHDFPNGVFAFRASARHGPHADFCLCNGPACTQRAPPLPFNPILQRFDDSVLDPEITPNVRPTMLDLLNRYVELDFIIPYSLDATFDNTSAGINGIISYRERRTIWDKLTSLLEVDFTMRDSKGRSANCSFVHERAPRSMQREDEVYTHALPKGIFAYTVDQVKGPHPKWCHCGGPSGCPPRGNVAASTRATDITDPPGPATARQRLDPADVPAPLHDSASTTPPPVTAPAQQRQFFAVTRLGSDSQLMSNSHSLQ